jgi:isochorismate synthase
MISNNAFFHQVRFLIKEKRSFAAFRNPESNLLECYVSSDKIPKKEANPSGSGFIIKPFNPTSGGYLISSNNIVSTHYLKNKESRALSFFEEKFPLDFKKNKKQYIDDVKSIVDQISFSDLIKVVYSNCFEFPLKSENTIEYFKNILDLYPVAFCYLFFHPEEGFWIGASPETLVEIQDNKISTMALAGTKILTDSNWSEKELLEQKIVEDEIKKTLNPHCQNLTSQELQTSKAGKIEHLKTLITGFTSKSPKEIVAALHPTPAVAGVPKNKAISIIAEKEKHDRSFYSGYLGKIDSKNCALFVNLRCLQIKDNNARLFVGGGITKDSIPEKEWEEIIHKSQTMIDALFK